MPTTLDSLNNIISQSTGMGNWPIFWTGFLPNNTTAATANSGSVTAQRYPLPITLPTLGTGVTGAHLTYCRAMSVNSGITVMVGIEYLLGTLTVSGNSYSHGVSMPTKTIRGTSTITAASEIFAVVTTTMSATTPVLTFNYTDQDGNTGASGSITMPSNAASGSAYRLSPHLASGDIGIRALSASGPNGLSISTGTSGVVRIYGVLPLWVGSQNVAYSTATVDPLTVSEVPYLVEAGENIGVYRYGITTNSATACAMNFIPSD